jgi:hypothetical protein
MKYIRSKRYKTDRKNPTGLAVCDFCGFNCNGGKLQKYYQYSGAPMPNYSVPNQYMLGGDVMGDGMIKWNGFMVCWHCNDKQNHQSMYVAPKGDPYPADGNRPQPSLEPQYNRLVSTENNIPLITEDESEDFFV